MLYENADEKKFKTIVGSLNPCFVGKCSTSELQQQLKSLNKLSLNPCFVGKCSTSFDADEEYEQAFLKS